MGRTVPTNATREAVAEMRRIVSQLHPSAIHRDPSWRKVSKGYLTQVRHGLAMLEVVMDRPEPEPQGDA